MRLVIPCSRAQTAMEREPRTGRMAPSRESSPMKMCRSRALTTPMAPRIPMATGRSKPAPSLRTLAEARLMDAFVGVAEAGVDEGALDPLAAFADGDIGHADHYGVARVAGGEHVDFDIDEVSINAINGGSAGFEQRQENQSGAGGRKRASIFGGAGRGPRPMLADAAHRAECRRLQEKRNKGCILLHRPTIKVKASRWVDDMVAEEHRHLVIVQDFLGFK